MNKKTIFILSIALIALIAASGCIGGPVTVCGNGTCEPPIETAGNCQADCGPKTGNLEVKVIDSITGEPIEGARVEAWLGEGPEPIPPVITDSEGIARFNQITPGVYLIEPAKDGYEQSAPTEKEVKAGETVYATTELTPSMEFDEISIGDGVLKYTDAQNISRTIPFYVELPNTSGGSVFTIAGQTFYYRCSQTDTNINIRNGDYLNGYKIQLDNNKLWAGFGSYRGRMWVNLTTLVQGTALYIGETTSEMRFDFLSFNATTATATIRADGNCQFSKQDFSQGTLYYLTINNAIPLNNTIYYDDDDAARVPTLPIQVKNSALMDAYNYRMYVGGITTPDSPIYLLLDGQLLSTTNGTQLPFLGTDTTEDPRGTSEKTYYWPDKTEFGNAPGDTAYLIAYFAPAEKNWSTIDVFIDTATDKTLVMPNYQLSFYTGCVYYDNNAHYVKCDGTDMTATTTYGSKIKVDDGVATIQIPIK